MIYSLKGTLTYLEPTFAVVECGGVGFKCFVSTTTITSLTSIGTEVRLLTYMSIREDAMDLYGFSTQNELDAFKLLISVNGVGPKAAISILSALPPDRLAVAVSCGDVKSIQVAQGVGKKTAERIVLELKDKMNIMRLRIWRMKRSETVSWKKNAGENNGFAKSEEKNGRFWNVL